MWVEEAQPETPQIADQDAENRPGCGQPERFQQEQAADVLVRCAQRFEQADFCGAAAYHHQHDVRHQNARHGKTDGRDAGNAQRQGAQDTVERSQHGILRNHRDIFLVIVP